MNNSLNQLIESSRGILVLLPANPNFDEVAAGLSFYLSIQDMKDASISCPSSMVVEFNRLIGINRISDKSGNKNLVIKFTNYDAKNIERVSYDIEGGEFQLSVIPKNGALAPKNEQINLSHSGVNADLVILIGGVSESQFPAVSEKELEGAKIVHLGTRPLQISKPVTSFERPASSISELTADLIKQSSFGLNQDIATNLIAGIEQGSENFRTPEVTSETFGLVSDLMKIGGRRTLNEQINRNTFPVGSIPGESIEIERQKEETEEAPQSWLEPKIYKGTSVS